MSATDPTKMSNKSNGATPPLDQAVGKRTPQQNLIAFLLPLIIFMFLSTLNPNFQGDETAPNAPNHYLWLIIIEVALISVVLAGFWKVYLSHFPIQTDYLGYCVGIIGFLAWIGICSLGLERALMTAVGHPDLLPERAGFDPYFYFPNNPQFTLFILFRFSLLSLIIPICEELFLRGWLVRYVEDPQWETVRLSNVGWRGCLAVIIYAVLTHPAEAVAAIVWFSLVSWLMIKTGKFWNCVAAHAVTNLLLGLYVLWSQQWQYW